MLSPDSATAPFSAAAVAPATPRLSVLVCTRNRANKLSRTIASILDNRFADFELIIVDQSTDERSKIVVESFIDPRIRHIEMHTIGLARARNLAIARSCAEIIVFTDDDCICEPEWLSAIMAEYEREPAAAGIFGRVLPYGEGRSDMYCPATIGRLERRVVDRPVVPSEVLGAGNNMSFRKSVFRDIGLFIETLGAGTPMKSGEDTEFVYRMLHHRMTLVYSATPLVYHDNWMTRQQFAALMRGSVLGGTAVFTKFALAFDRQAALYLARIGYYLLRDKIGVGSVSAGFASFFRGMVVGLRYAVEQPPAFREPQ
jgi:glycosyltransferase involved in cell wall biosynthesis